MLNYAGYIKNIVYVCVSGLLICNPAYIKNCIYKINKIILVKAFINIFRIYKVRRYDDVYRD